MLATYSRLHYGIAVQFNSNCRSILCLALAWHRVEVVVGWLEGEEEERERVSVGWEGEEDGLGEEEEE